MGNSLLIYLNKRLKEENTFEKSTFEMAGPVITISREVGCNGLKLAQLLANHLNHKNTGGNWKVFSKEIFYASARELNLDPEKIRKLFKKSDRYTFEEILNAFGDKNYKSEQKIAKTVTDIIRTIAIEGHCIIVGRAGHIITKDIKNALHIRLTAPLAFRINNIQENNQLSYEEAKLFNDKDENERKAFRKAIHQESLREELFDITLNRASFGSNEIVDLLETALHKKHILQVEKQRVEIF